MALSVHEAIKRVADLHDQHIEISGILHFEFEDFCISCEPAQIRGSLYSSSIWTNYEQLRTYASEEELEQFDGKSVVVSGVLRKPRPGYPGCGHFSAWPAEIFVYEVVAAEDDA